MAKKAATILAEAQQELLETNAKLSDTGRRRDQLLLAGDERGLDAIEVELANCRRRPCARLIGFDCLSRKPNARPTNVASRNGRG